MLQIVVVVLLVVFALALRNRGRRSLPDKPEETVSQFFTAAGEGDDRGYLQLTTGELREALESDRAQAGAEAFRESLRRSAEGLEKVTTGDELEETVKQVQALTDRADEVLAGLDRSSKSLESILGRDDRFDWDRAYLVRREAEEALGYL